MLVQSYKNYRINNPSGTWQALLLTSAYSLWWVYIMFMKPINLSDPFLLQNIVLLSSIIAVLITLAIQVLIRKDIVINRQYIAWACLIALSLFSLIWAKNPLLAFQFLKFNIFLVGIGVLTLNVVGSYRLTNYWIYYILSFSFIALTYGSFLFVKYGSLRAPAVDLNPNHYLVAGITAFPLAIHIFYHSRRVLRLISVMLVFLAGAVFVFSQSRSAIPVVAVWLIVLLIFDHDQLAGWTYSHTLAVSFSGFGALLTVLVIAIDPTLFGRIFTQSVREAASLTGPIRIEDPSRVQIYKFAGYLLTDARTYMTGVGYHMFNIEFALYTGLEPRNPHNAYLKSLFELGFLGLILFIAVVIYPIRYGISTIRMSMTKSEKSLAIALLWSYVGLLVFGMFQPLRGHFQLYLLSAVLFGLLINITNK